jgi:hypothetical protein
VTFAAIVERYKVQPHCRQQEVLRAVPLEQDGGLVTLSTTDIIKWYNKVSSARQGGERELSSTTVSWRRAPF